MNILIQEVDMVTGNLPSNSVRDGIPQGENQGKLIEAAPNTTPPIIDYVGTNPSNNADMFHPF